MCFTLILICLANFGSSMCWWQRFNAEGVAEFLKNPPTHTYASSLCFHSAFVEVTVFVSHIWSLDHGIAVHFTLATLAARHHENFSNRRLRCFSSPALWYFLFSSTHRAFLHLLLLSPWISGCCTLGVWDPSDEIPGWNPKLCFQNWCNNFQQVKKE